jgi:hypothetical protein
VWAFDLSDPAQTQGYMVHEGTAADDYLTLGSTAEPAPFGGFTFRGTFDGEQATRLVDITTPDGPTMRNFLPEGFPQFTMRHAYTPDGSASVCYGFGGNNPDQTGFWYAELVDGVPSSPQLLTEGLVPGPGNPGSRFALAADGSGVFFPFSEEGGDGVQLYYSPLEPELGPPTAVTSFSSYEIDAIEAHGNHIGVVASPLFDQDNSLYAADISNPLAPPQLLSDTPSSANPAWSASGERVLYWTQDNFSTGQLYVIGFDGGGVAQAPVEITSANQLANKYVFGFISEDLAFYRGWPSNEHTDIYTVDLSGPMPGPPTSLNPNAGDITSMSDVVVSPGRTRVMYQTSGNDAFVWAAELDGTTISPSIQLVADAGTWLTANFIDEDHVVFAVRIGQISAPRFVFHADFTVDPPDVTQIDTEVQPWSTPDTPPVVQAGTHVLVWKGDSINFPEMGKYLYRIGVGGNLVEALFEGVDDNALDDEWMLIPASN